LSVGQQRFAGVQCPPSLEERVAASAAVAEGVLLGPLAALL
jgi:hypothetical protein